MPCVALQTGEAARLRMVKSNERLVWHVARKYQNRGLDIEDLIAEGMNGLLKGVEKFDPNKGFKFSTYAHWWVRQGITRAISEQVLDTPFKFILMLACPVIHGRNGVLILNSALFSASSFLGGVSFYAAIIERHSCSHGVLHTLCAACSVPRGRM